jgi:hypothetical protein
VKTKTPKEIHLFLSYRNFASLMEEGYQPVLLGSVETIGRYSIGIVIETPDIKFTFELPDHS